MDAARQASAAIRVDAALKAVAVIMVVATGKASAAKRVDEVIRVFAVIR